MLWRKLATERVVVLSLESPELVQLDGTAAALWEVCVEPLTFHEVVDLMAAAYGAEPQGVAEDLRPALDELCGRGIFRMLVTT